MKEKLRQLFGGDQKQAKTKEVAEQEEQKVREESMEEENTDNDEIIIEEDDEWDDDYEWDGDGWSRKPYKEKAEGAYEYTARDYEELKIKLHEAEDEITDLEGQIHDLMVECRQVDKLLTQTHMELKDEAKKRKKSDETARAAQRAVSELERVKTILGAENAAEAAQGLLEELERVKEELKSKNAENKRQSGKIAHLSRIMYERANADRDLRPKRQHTGYAVISSTQKEIKGKKVWETLLSLPCPASLEVQFVDERIRKEFFSEEGLIRNIGITDIYEGNYDSMRSEMRNRRKNPDEINVALSYKLRQNFRGKYWEAIITHTKPLSKIPDDMMLQNDKQKEEKGKKKKKQKQEEKKEVEANQ